MTYWVCVYVQVRTSIRLCSLKQRRAGLFNSFIFLTGCLIIHVLCFGLALPWEWRQTWSMAVEATKMGGTQSGYWGNMKQNHHTLFHTKWTQIHKFPVNGKTHAVQTHQVHICSRVVHIFMTTQGRWLKTSKAQTKNKDNVILMLKSATCRRHNPVPSQNVLILSA